MDKSSLLTLREAVTYYGACAIALIILKPLVHGALNSAMLGLAIGTVVGTLILLSRKL